MRVELLYSDADPNYMTARQRLVEVLTEDAFETPIQMIAVNTDADAELLGFPGSPTIRIDDVDIHPAGVRDDRAAACAVIRATTTLTARSASSDPSRRLNLLSRRTRPRMGTRRRE